MTAVLAAFVWGLRHGIDVDHLAAIGDLSAASPTRRAGFGRASWYVAGHATVLGALGAAAVVAGTAIPGSVDEAFGRVVGLTLLALGLWTVWAVHREGDQFRFRSRVSMLQSWLRRPGEDVVVVHDHPHHHDHEHGSGHGHVHADGSAGGGDLAGGHAAAGGEAAAVPRTATAHRHLHVHRGSLPPQPAGRAAALTVGMVHGVGAETPTLVIVLAAATGATSTGAGLAYLAAFMVGLVAANSLVALGFAAGLVDPDRRPRSYRLLGWVVGAASAVVGVVLLAGGSVGLPFWAGG